MTMAAVKTCLRESNASVVLWICICFIITCWISTVNAQEERFGYRPPFEPGDIPPKGNYPFTVTTEVFADPSRDVPALNITYEILAEVYIPRVRIKGRLIPEEDLPTVIYSHGKTTIVRQLS